MDKEFILTQTKTVTMMRDKTITKTDEILETIDLSGKREIVLTNKKSFVKYHTDNFRRAV
ncbi:MAG: hypothetical protein K5768_10365 [Firmicutes bacterium]|nr:hypothetical protein [Bacillota bacterium]